MCKVNESERGRKLVMGAYSFRSRIGSVVKFCVNFLGVRISSLDNGHRGYGTCDLTGPYKVGGS